MSYNEQDILHKALELNEEEAAEPVTPAPQHHLTITNLDPAKQYTWRRVLVTQDRGDRMKDKISQCAIVLAGAHSRYSRNDRCEESVLMESDGPLETRFDPGVTQQYVVAAARLIDHLALDVAEQEGWIAERYITKLAKIREALVNTGLVG